MFNIVGFLSLPVAKFVIIPVITTLLTNILKFICENDRYSHFSNDFFYWGPNLCATSLLLLFIEFGKGGNAEGVVNGFIFWVVAVFSIIILVRKKGWEEDPLTKKIHHKLWCGIIWPNSIGFVQLFIVLNLLGS